MPRRALEIVITGDSTRATRAFRGVTNEAAVMNRSVTASSSKAATAMGKVNDAGHRLTRRFRGTAVAATALVGATVAVSSAVGAIGKETVGLDQGMRNVNSIAQVSEKRFGRLKNQVLALSGPTAQAPQVLADGLYDLVSSGFKASEAMGVLRASANAATAGLTTAEVSTATVAAVLNAYRLPASKAKDVSDVLFRTVDRGVISFEQLSSTIGDVLPFASSLDVSLRQVGASVATMTKAGIGPAETMTRIKNVMVSLIKPGEGLKKAYDDLGVASGEQLIKQKGFQGALESLAGTTDGTKEAVAALFPNIRALGGVLALTGGNAKSAGEDVRGMQAATGATARALEQQSQSVALKWQRLQAQAKVLAVRIGDDLVPVAQEYLDVISNPKLDASAKIDRLSDMVERQSETVAAAIPRIVETVTPAVTAAGGKLGIAAIEGMAKGWADSDVLGKVITTGVIIRMVGGPGSLIAIGRAMGGYIGIGVGQGVGAATVAGGIGGRRGGIAPTTVATGGLVKGWGSRTGAAQKAYDRRWSTPYGQLSGFERNPSTSTMAKTAAGLAPAISKFKGLAKFAGGAALAIGSVDAAMAALDQKGGILAKGQRAAETFLPFGLGEKAFDALGGGSLSKIEKKNAAQAKAAILGKQESEYLGRQVKSRKDLKEIVESVLPKLVEEGRITERQASRLAQVADKRAPRVGLKDSMTKTHQQAAKGVYTDKDLARVTERNLSRISQLYNRYTPQWRGSVIRAMQAQMDGIRVNWTKGGKLTEQGAKKIERIQKRLQMLMSGSDPIKIGEGFVKSWRKADKATQINVSAVSKQLRKMPPEARDQAAKAMVNLARTLEQQKKLPEGTMRKLRSRLVADFPQMWERLSRDADKGMDGAARATKRGGDAMVRDMLNLRRRSGTAMRDVQRNVTQVVNPLRTAYQSMAGDANTAAAAFGSAKRVQMSLLGPTPAQSKRTGGAIRRRYRLGGLVPAYVSPGEMIEHRGKAFIVPGKREPRDSVFMPLPPGARVYTDDGQDLLARGVSPAQALARQAAHFRAGGEAGRKVPQRTLAGGPDITRDTGQAAINQTREAALAWVRRYAMLPARVRRMQAYGDRIAAKGLGYQYGGGHGALGVGSPSFDCSGYVSGILGAGGFIGSPMAVAQGSGLYTLGQGGPGQFFTWGVRGSSGRNAHTMIKVGKKFYEASGAGVGTRGGWSGSFAYRHIKGYRQGGLVPDDAPPAAKSAVERWGAEALNPRSPHFIGWGYRRGGVVKRYRDGGKVTGRVSWFGDGTTASGISAASRAGVALNLSPGSDSGWNNDTTQGWMTKAREGRPVYARVTIAGKEAVLPIIDLGPAGSTGRAIDVTRKGIEKMGFTTANFPTDAGGVATILGTTITSKEAPSSARQRRTAARLADKAENIRKDTAGLAGQYKRYGGTRGGQKALDRARKLLDKVPNAGRLTSRGDAKKAISRRRGLIRDARDLIDRAGELVGTPGLGKTALSPEAKTAIAALPKGQRAGIRSLLRSPGLTWEATEAIIQMAIATAEGTESALDDRAVHKWSVKAQRQRKAKLRKRLAEINRELGRKGLTKARRKRLLGQRDALTATLGGLREGISADREAMRESDAPTATDYASLDLARASLTDTLDDDRKALEKLKGLAEAGVSEAAKTADPRDDIEAIEVLKSILDQIKSLNDQATEAERERKERERSLAEELRLLRQAMESEQAIQTREMARALVDLTSRGIAAGVRSAPASGANNRLMRY